MATAHNEANIGDIAKTVIMPGDPLRAKMIAETYLENYKLVNQIRNMYAYTGTYKGKEITVMASGMGMPSIGIYSYELFHNYGVDRIIRVGTAGSYVRDLNLFDILLVNQSYTDSSYGFVQNGDTTQTLDASPILNNTIQKKAEETHIPLTIGNVYCSDVFYKEHDNFKEMYQKYGCISCEMESFALFHNAKLFGKEAACVLTISNSFVTNEETTSEQRQNAFTSMIELVLNAILEMS